MHAIWSVLMVMVCLYGLGAGMHGLSICLTYRWWKSAVVGVVLIAFNCFTLAYWIMQLAHLIAEG